jgi:multimeric flavodoxin WrbA
MTTQIPESLQFSHKQRYGTLAPNSVKNILVLQGSPRKDGVSKTEIVASAFLTGCEEAGAKVEIINLREKKISHCQGCYTCWTKTPGKCIFKDDVADIMKKTNAADLVLYALPLYHFGIISLMKKYIERTLPSMYPYLITRDDGATTHPDREGYKTKKNVAILGVCGFPEVKHFGALSANFHYLSNAGGEDGMNIVAEIYRPMAEILNNPFYAEENSRILAAAKKAGSDLISKGFVDAETVDAIADVRLDKDELYDAANKSWDHCINEKITMPELQKQLLE